jgi:hypothetical protein
MLDTNPRMKAKPGVGPSVVPLSLILMQSDLYICFSFKFILCFNNEPSPDVP